MTDQDFLTTAETQALERDAKQAIESAVSNVSTPRTSIRDVRRLLRALVDEDEVSTIPRQFAYGYVRLDTDVVFREVDSQGRLHLVAAVTGDEVEEITFWEIDGTLVELGSQTDSDGNVDRPAPLGRFLNIARLREKLGVPGQQADSFLRHETSVDDNFVGSGIAYVYGRFKAKQGALSGDPPIKVICRARKAIDPRDGVQRWTINPIVHAYDLLVKAKRLGGAERSLEEIDVASFQVAADFGEELLAAKEFTRIARVDQFSIDQVKFSDDPVLDFQYGDVVNVFATAGQTLPAGLTADTDYHVVPRRHRVGDVGEIGAPSMRLATTFANAMADVTLSFTVTTDFQVKKVKEVRYACAASYRGRFDRSVLEGILATCGAKLTNKGGKISLVLQTFPAVTKTVTIDDIQGNLTLSHKLPRRQRTTSLTGSFLSPARLFPAR